MTEKEEPGQLVGFEKMAQRILESFEKRMEQFILQAVKQSQGTVYNLEGAFVSLAFTDETGTIHLKKLTN